MAEPGAPTARLPSEDGDRRPAERSSLRAHVSARSGPRSTRSCSKLVQEHTSTIVFVNNRRAAERLAKRLNELANERSASRSCRRPSTAATTTAGASDAATGPEIARAHHGSLSHEERAVVEEMLKSGQLPCLVATSSLELGIDMGAVDLVIQVESPKSVTRGLQRIGRAGHGSARSPRAGSSPSSAPTCSSARSSPGACATARSRRRSIPQNPLDVLAQHLVSMAALDEWEVDEVERLVTATEPFRELSREQLENVLDMLDGRYPSDRFAELRPRIVWDRTEGTIHGRKGARQLVVTNAGTIPDRGLYGVHLPDGRRVGELDEEMVYEARPGQTFLLGASTWRIEEITRDRVIVTPAPGAPGAVPFWRGDGIGRPAELGRAIGAFSREAVSRDPEELAEGVRPRRARRREPRLLPARAAGGDPRRPLRRDDRRSSASATRSATGASASSRPYGGRVHSAWGLALAREDPRRARPRGRRDLVRRRHRHPPARRRRAAPRRPRPDRARRDRGPGRRASSPARPCSAPASARTPSRSLLIPRAYPGKRTPLWQQRLKSQSLLEVARDFPRFPVILETYRECLQDVLDLPALARAAARAALARGCSLVEVETPTASPFASSLLFDYVATYMYEGDTPNAERRAAALALDRDLLRELLGQEELRELIDPEALDEVEEQLQHRTEAVAAGDRDALQQVLRRLGDLTAEECEQRVAEGYSAASMLEKLVAERRVAKVRIAGEERYIAAEDAGLYRDALGGAAAGRAAGGLPRAASTTRSRARPPLRPHPRPLPDRAAGRALRRRSRRRRCASSSAKGRWSAASCCPAAPSASGATPTSCAGSAAPASPACARRSRRPTAASSPASCRAGRTSTPTAPPAPGSTACARRWCRCRASR